MATSKSSKRPARKSSRNSGKRSTEKSAVTRPTIPGAYPIVWDIGGKRYTEAGLREMGRRTLEAMAAADAAKAEREARQAEVDASIERRKREGVTLKGERRELAIRALYNITLGAASIHHLALEADHHDASDAGWFTRAIADASIVLARRADIVLALLGDPGASNFDDETDPAEAIRQADNKTKVAEAEGDQ
jgi:hypothetical protein